jgi:rubrerythrin
MGRNVVTTSSVISFSESLEDRSAALYKDLAEAFPQERDMFLSMAEDCEKVKTSVVRTYRETVSDALETGFSFEGLDLSDYDVDVALEEDVAYEEALRMAIALEERASDFYRDVGGRSRSLLATISMAFSSAARKRKRRRQRLQSLLG